MDKAVEVRFVGKRRLCVLVVLYFFHRVESGSVSAHQSGDVAAYNLDSHLLLKGSEHSVVEEGSALNHDSPAELVGAGRADNLVQRVLNDRKRKSGGDVLYRRAVLLSLLYGGVHKHRTSRAQIHRVLCENTLVREVLDRIAEGVGECLQKASAARGASLVEEKIVDSSVVYFEALNILPADVDNKLNVGHKVLSRCKMRDSLDDTVIDRERVFDDVLAVAGDRGARNIEVGVKLVNLLQKALDKLDGVTL